MQRICINWNGWSNSMNMELKITGIRHTDPLSTHTTNQVADPVYEQRSSRIIWNRMYAPVCGSHFRTALMVKFLSMSAVWCSLVNSTQFVIYSEINSESMAILASLTLPLALQTVQVDQSKCQNQNDRLTTFSPKKVAKQIQLIKIPNLKSGISCWA